MVKLLFPAVPGNAVLYELKFSPDESDVYKLSAKQLIRSFHQFIIILSASWLQLFN
ncbi:MAG: hypothetical protein ACXWWC_11215 [Chitinophagaceae bacterium]